MATWPRREKCGVVQWNIAVTKLQADALVTVNPALAVKAKDLVPLAPLEALTKDLD
jgi:hypothetical protein